MKCFGSDCDKVLHFEKCIYCSKITYPIEFEILEDAVKQGFKLAQCCREMRDLLFSKEFVIKGPKVDTIFHSRKVYYPEDVIS